MKPEQEAEYTRDMFDRDGVTSVIKIVGAIAFVLGILIALLISWVLFG